MLDKNEINVLVLLICEKQIAMIRNNHSNFNDEAYISLEKLKAKIKEMEK